MRRVELLTQLADIWGTRYPGDTIDVDDDTATRLITSGQAVPCPESRETMTTQPVEKRGPKRR